MALIGQTKAKGGIVVLLLYSGKVWRAINLKLDACAPMILGVKLPNFNFTNTILNW